MAKKVARIRKQAIAALRSVRRGAPEKESVHELRTGLRRFEALSRKSVPGKLRKAREEAPIS